MKINYYEISNVKIYFEYIELHIQWIFKNIQIENCDIWSIKYKMLMKCICNLWEWEMSSRLSPSLCTHM